MNLFENYKNLIEKFKSMKEEDLEAWKYLLIFLIVVDMFGVYYWLELKSFGIALLFMMIIFLTIILILERRLPKKSIHTIDKEVKKMDEETKKTNEEDEYLDLTPKEPKKEEKTEGIMGNMDLGLPDAEEYKKRMEKAYGTV